MEQTVHCLKNGNMTEQQDNKLCQDCLETIIDRLSPDSRTSRHLQTCSKCQQALTNLEHIRREKTALADESHTELKLKLLKKLTPIIARNKTIREPAFTSFSWLWKFVSAFAVILIGMALLLLKPGNAPQSTPGNTPLTSQQFCTISVNGGEKRQVSLDNPIALFANESGEVTLPDHSRLLLTGPVRLTVASRGFHLVHGYVKAEVARGSEEFSATTPHGIITVLGTVFVCDTNSRFTTVEVLSGKVRVSSDDAPAVVLGPGDKTRMGHQTVGSPETGTIPSLDSE